LLPGSAEATRSSTPYPNRYTPLRTFPDSQPTLASQIPGMNGSMSEAPAMIEASGTEEAAWGRLPYHREARVEVAKPAHEVFVHLDDHARLSAHMTKRTWMMAGSRMTLDLDDARGRAVGSVIRLSGRFLGIRLDLEEVVVERTPPSRKIWETTTEPRLLVVGRYRMGFAVEPRGDVSLLTVFIDYALPSRRFEHLLGRVVAPLYARWCVHRMAADAAHAS
jgi:hypothetical protein